jgi:hypothetical protein
VASLHDADLGPSIRPFRLSGLKRGHIVGAQCVRKQVPRCVVLNTDFISCYTSIGPSRRRTARRSMHAAKYEKWSDGQLGAITSCHLPAASPGVTKGTRRRIHDWPHARPTGHSKRTHVDDAD